MHPPQGLTNNIVNFIRKSRFLILTELPRYITKQYSYIANNEYIT
jgi:hypothetical protein